MNGQATQQEVKKQYQEYHLDGITQGESLHFSKATPREIYEQYHLDLPQTKRWERDRLHKDLKKHPGYYIAEEEYFARTKWHMEESAENKKLRKELEELKKLKTPESLSSEEKEELKELREFKAKMKEFGRLALFG